MSEYSQTQKNRILNDMWHGGAAEVRRGQSRALNSTGRVYRSIEERREAEGRDWQRGRGSAFVGSKALEDEINKRDRDPEYHRQVRANLERSARSVMDARKSSALRSSSRLTGTEGKDYYSTTGDRARTEKAESDFVKRRDAKPANPSVGDEVRRSYKNSSVGKIASGIKSAASKIAKASERGFQSK